MLATTSSAGGERDARSSSRLVPTAWGRMRSGQTGSILGLSVRTSITNRAEWQRPEVRALSDGWVKPLMPLR